jgi:hypothetical protein
MKNVTFILLKQVCPLLVDDSYYWLLLIINGNWVIHFYTTIRRGTELFITNNNEHT